MLNEFEEFKAYTSNPESNNPRIQPKSFTEYYSDDKNLIGLEEIMTVIARGYLFSDGRDYKDEVIDDKTLNNVKELLHRWTGFSNIENEKKKSGKKVAVKDKKIINKELYKWMRNKNHPVKDGWLKIYWTTHYKLEKNKLSKKSDNLLWDELEEKWTASLNGLDYRAKKYSYNNIVANALEIGPLRNRYFIFKKDESQIGKKVKEKDSKRFKYLTNRSGIHETTIMKLMKLLATYLILKEYHPDTHDEVYIKKDELVRWYGLDDNNNGSDTWYLTNLEWTNKTTGTQAKAIDKPIVMKKNEIDNIVKIVIDKDYLNKYDFKIINEEEIGNYNSSEYWILEDKGHGLENCWNLK